MKLLLDENIPFALVKGLLDEFTLVHHVLALGLIRANDTIIWQFARQNGYAVLTQDKDFFERSRFDSSVKVIWVRFGNASIRDFENWLRSDSETIRHFLEESSESCLILKRPAVQKRAQVVD